MHCHTLMRNGTPKFELDLILFIDRTLLVIKQCHDEQQQQQ